MDGHAMMNSWMASNYAATEQPMNPQYASWSSSTTSNQPSPGRRELAVQPPLLTTALSGPQFHPVNTPLSTTSLSSPFIQSHSPYVASPANGRSASSSSSMASRQPANYSVPYNPQDWGPMGGAPAQGPYHQSNSAPRVAPQQRTYADESLSPPPPPYSPPSNPNRSSPDTYGSPNPNIAVTSATSPPQNFARENEFEPSASYQRRTVQRPRPASMIYGNEAGPSRQSLPPPPPPPQGHPGSRSVSQSRIDAYQGAPYSGAGAHHRPRVSSSNYEQPFPSPSLNGNTHGPSFGQLGAPERPPASRRAASAGAVVSSAGTSRAISQTRNNSPSNNGWGPGMPLPPPPPGPPPAQTLSVSGSSESSSARTVHGPSRNRPPPAFGTGLGSIPPTPADWVDEEYINHRPTPETEPLSIDTTKAQTHHDPVPDPNSNDPYHQSQRTPGSGGSGLFRSSAIRDPSAKGIRERRIERRNQQSQNAEVINSAVSTSGNPWADSMEKIRPSNLVFPENEATSPEPIRQPASSRATPQSSRSIGSDGRTGSRSRASSGGLFSDKSSHTTPKWDSSPVAPSAAFAQTPPFSPKGESSSSYPREVPRAIPPKSLPTPPLNSGNDLKPRPRALSRGPEDRPVSHILHIPNEAISSVKPLSPRRVPGPQAVQQQSLESIMKQDTNFVQEAMQRHREFIEKESAAVSEVDALKIFTDFMINESKIRRTRYATVWESNPAVVEDVPSKLFAVQPVQNTKPARPAPTLEIPQNRTSRPDSAWWNSYQPCLSPIASLSMSNDEQSSRGRAPSRWWESKTGSSSDEAGRRVQRSKRESKYMGLPRDGLQWDAEKTPSKLDDVGSHYTGEYAAYGPDEYPPEKVGLHEEFSYSNNGHSNSSAQFQASQKLDISRLITLPPPYPRHYPAVNNSHPELVSYRTIVRSITDLSEIKSTRERYQEDVKRMSEEQQGQSKEGRRQFKANIQSQIQEGSLTFAEAAEAEAAMLAEENRIERGLVKQQLDAYQDIVLKPMHAILTDRIDKATACIDELSGKLFDDARNETPDQTQEEGDEKPELLEKLTQLKWLFEAREQLHREAFDLVSGRDEKYKALALLPYQQSKNNEKLWETQDFFSKDTLDRRVKYEISALNRLGSFLDVIEQNVVRGVEIQLSAFWDIAPSLLVMVQQIPEDLHGFQVRIPANEYEENPSYHAHPLQYLYTLLSHAEKSSYQYIESQTNLLCLLHEVRSAMMRANRNLAEAERIWQGESEEDVRASMQQTRADEELNLTSDLKEKVATVEGQWAEALGSQIQEVRERVQGQLIAEDGWDDLERLEQE